MKRTLKQREALHGVRNTLGSFLWHDYVPIDQLIANAQERTEPFTSFGQQATVPRQTNPQPFTSAFPRQTNPQQVEQETGPFGGTIPRQTNPQPFASLFGQQVKQEVEPFSEAFPRQTNPPEQQVFSFGSGSPFSQHRAPISSSSQTEFKESIPPYPIPPMDPEKSQQVARDEQYKDAMWYAYSPYRRATSYYRARNERINKIWRNRRCVKCGREFLTTYIGVYPRCQQCFRW